MEPQKPPDGIVPRASAVEGDAASSTPARTRRQKVHFALAFTAISVVAFTSALDATILAVALPIVAESLQMSSLESFWAGIAFLLSSVLFQPVHTALSEIFGRKLILYVCLVFFATGCIIVGTAHGATALIAGRTIQGVGGGGMEALCEVILTDITTLKERPLYIGLLGFMWAAGSILAPIIGGLFAEYVDWRWIAWVNLPLIGVAMVLIPPFLTLAKDKSSIRSKARRIDQLGIALFMVGMTTFTLGLTWGGQLFPWRSTQTLFPIIFGAAVLCVLAWYEKYPEAPMLSPRLFSTATSAVAYLGSFIHGIIIWCLVYYLVLYFQGAIQALPFQAAVDAFPLAFTLTPSAIVCAMLIDWIRRYLWSVWLGWTLSTVGVATMVLLDYDSSSALYHGLQIAPGIGTGFLLSALAVPLQASMDVNDVGAAMGTLVFFRALGSVVGVAMGSAIFTNQFEESLVTISLPTNVTLPDSSDAVYFLTQIRQLHLGDEAMSKILELYAAPIKYIWITVACLSAVGLLSSFAMKELTLEREEVGRQALQHRGTPPPDDGEPDGGESDGRGGKEKGEEQRGAQKSS